MSETNSRWQIMTTNESGEVTAVHNSTKKPSQQKQKRSQACVTCRRQKMKCQFSENSDPPRCDRCKVNNTECRFEVRANDKQWTTLVEERLRRLEENFNDLIEQLQQGRHNLPSPIGEGIYPIENHSNTMRTGNKRSISSMDSLSADGVASTVSSSPTSPGLPALYVTIGGTGRTSDKPPSQRPNKRAKKYYDDVITRGVINIEEANECIQFFNTKLARYLPILIFKYLGQFDLSIRERSPLLFLSILSVASLYHPLYQAVHGEFRQAFTKLANSAEIASIPTEGTKVNVYEIIDIVVALSLAGAWLGGEQGFQMSLLASEYSGIVFPSVQQALNGPEDQEQKQMISAVGLMTYIIEQRLRIIHARPVDPNQTVDGQRRDQFFAHSLSSFMAHRKNNHEMDVAELKINANVELCAIILMLQLDLRRDIRVGVITHWNSQLDKWLSEWMGKLTVYLLPSSWKPVLLTFHFAKLFLNSLPVSSTMRQPRPSEQSNNESTNNETPQGQEKTWQDVLDGQMDHNQRVKLTMAAESSALDILDMLIHDRDIERLIGVGPVFYPTIFITACALLLKLVTTSRSNGYAADEQNVIRIVSEAYAILKKKIASEVLPCQQSVKNLGIGLSRVSEHLNYRQQHQMYSPTPHAQMPIMQEQVLVQPVTNHLDFNSTMPIQDDLTNFWSFSRYRDNNDLDLNVVQSSQPQQQPPRQHSISSLVTQSEDIWPIYVGVQGLNSNDQRFMMDAYSSSLLDSLPGSTPGSR